MGKRAIIGVLMLVCCAAMTAGQLLLYAPFDGSADAVFSGGDAANLHPQQSYAKGKAGQAVMVEKDCEFRTEGNFNLQSGTISLWLRPNWAGDAAGSRYLFCLYGADEIENSWATNRWSISFSGGDCRFVIYTDVPEERFAVTADIEDWRQGQWHNVVATWSGVNSGRSNGEMRLYIDGQRASVRDGSQISVGAVNEFISIGRDQDGSPDYADAAIDELFIYAEALEAGEIAAGYEYVQGGRERVELPSIRPPAGAMEWWDRNWPLRAGATVSASAAERGSGFVECPLRMSAQLPKLGLPGRIVNKSIRVVDPKGNVVPSRIENGIVQWRMPEGGSQAGQQFHLYAQPALYRAIEPLQVAVARREIGRGPTGSRPPDYAAVAHSHPWNFDDDTFAGIDQWGDKPEYIRNRKVENGVLSMDVKTDPFFIWGNMWGQVNDMNREIAIDVERFPILEMRIKQSVESATWQLFGRPMDGGRLLRHELTVTGNGWQTVRVNLREDARWGGVLSAFRIDPTDGTQAHIEIDYVRLVATAFVEHGPVETIGFGEHSVAAVNTTIGAGRVTAGSAHELTVSVTDAAGRGVADQPVRFELVDDSAGRLESSERHRSLRLNSQARRALTGKNGKGTVWYIASEKAMVAADRIVAVAEFTGVKSSAEKVDTVAGAADHYLVQPEQTTVLHETDLPLKISAQLVDAHDNPVTGDRRLSWHTDAAASIANAETQFDEDGRAEGQWSGDEAQRWVYHVSVKDEKGMEGRSAAICLLPSEKRQRPIVLGDDERFHRGKGGPVWFPLGGFYANWVGLPKGGEEGRKLISFVDATEGQLRHWLKFLASQGVTAMRFMLRAHTSKGLEPMDVIGRVNMPLFAKVLRYMDLARKHDIKFMLTIHEDYTKPAYYNRHTLKTFCLPRYQNEALDGLPEYQRRFVRDRDLIDTIHEKYTDPDVIACQDQYMRQLIPLLRDNPQLFAWELENEMVNCPASWANHAVNIIREIDPVTPICASHGGGGLKTADPLWWMRNTSVDFYTYHLYPTRTTTSPEIDYGAAVDILTRYGRMTGPCMLGESSGDWFRRYPKQRDAEREYIMRDIIWFSIINGNPGCFFWNARGREVRQFRLASEIVSSIDWSNWSRRTPHTGIDVRHRLEDDRYYQSENGEADYAMLGRYVQHYLDTGCDFAFTMRPGQFRRVGGLDEFAPPPCEPLISADRPWQIAVNARKDAIGGLAYVRNMAGIRHWQEKGRRRAANMYLRERKVAPLTLQFNIRLDAIAVDVIDLDTGDRRSAIVEGRGQLAVGATAHDQAVVWEAR